MYFKNLFATISLLLVLLTYQNSFAIDTLKVINICRTFVAEKNLKTAYNIGMDTIASDPYNAAGHYCLGHMYFIQQDYNKALVYLGAARNAIRNDKTVPDMVRLVIDMNYLTSLIGSGKISNPNQVKNEVERTNKKLKSLCYFPAYRCENILVDVYFFHTIASSFFYHDLKNDRKACDYVGDLLAALSDTRDLSEDPQIIQALQPLIQYQYQRLREYGCVRGL